MLLAGIKINKKTGDLFLKVLQRQSSLYQQQSWENLIWSAHQASTVLHGFYFFVRWNDKCLIKEHIPVIAMSVKKTLHTYLLMLLLATHFGVYLRVLFFSLFYLKPFYSGLQMSILNLIWYLGVSEIYIGRH